MTASSPKTGAQVVVESLERQGVQYVFGIPGAKIDKVFDTLASSSIQTVVCRHEQNAAFIAGGIGRLTGRAGVAIIKSADEIGSQLRRAFEMSGPVLIGINVDYRDNHKLFEKVHEHLLI